VSFQSLLQLIQERDPVVAGKVNSPLRQIDQNVRYVWDLLKAAGIGSTVYAREQTVEAEAKVGMAVYLNKTTQRFERGLALAEVDQASGIVATAESSQVWGVLASKRNATLADILLFGVDTIDLSEAVDGTPAAGVYYLSSAAPGKLVQQKPPVSVAVLRRTTTGTVFVMPQFVDYLDRHTHYRFDLKCAPAATHVPPAPGARHVLTDPTPSRRGWLPADNPVFGGKAPAGAVYGYNLSQEPKLSALWPPVPLTNAELEWNKAIDTDVGFTGVPLGRDGLCVLDRNGIWWMSDCYGDVPWPVDYGTGNSASASDSVGSECPRLTEMALRLYFSRVNFATDSAVVLSVHSRDARLKVRCYGDTERPASTGHIELLLDLNLTVQDDAVGFLALKEFDPATSKFKRGAVAEGLYALSGNVTLTGDVSGSRTVGGTARTVYQGLVGVTVDPADTKEIDVQLYRLDGALEEYWGDPPNMYLELPAGDQTNFRGKLYVPADLAIPSPQMRLRLLVLGRAVGTLPQLTFSGRIVPRPSDGLNTPVDLPADGEEFTITCDTTGTLTGAGQYVEAVSEPFDVAAGDVVYFTVQRESGDGYAGAVGVIRQAGVLSSGA